MDSRLFPRGGDGMKFWVGVTDNKWYQFLSQLRPDEVNFWQPRGTPPFTGAPIGLPFLFKLRRPYNHIAGGGFFVKYSSFPLSIVWDIFRQKNGCASLDEFRALIAPLTANRRSDVQSDVTFLPILFSLIQGNGLIYPIGRRASCVGRCTTRP